MQMFLVIQKSKGALQALLLIAYTYFLNTFIIFKQDGKKVLGSNPLDGFFLASSHSLKTSTVAGVNVTMNSLFVLTTCTGCTSPLALCQLGSRPASTLN